jgi:beta-glucosidase
MAKNVDAVVFVGGISSLFESEDMGVHVEGFLNGDRTIIELPKVQQLTLDNLQLTGKPVIFVLCQGSATSFNTSTVNAWLDAWYPGQAGGLAVADVLFGDYNPAGRLPVTFYEKTSDLNEFHDYNMLTGKGRTYRYFKGKPLFPFGYGLSYTKFRYSNLEIMGDFTKGESVDVSFVVENIGDLAGDEVSQIYVSAIDVPDEPIKALKWFKRQQFEVSEVREFVARLHSEAFMIYDEAKDEMVLRPGKFRIAVGGSSDDKDLIWRDVVFPVQDSNGVGGRQGLFGEKNGWKIAVIILGLIGLAFIMIALIYRAKSRKTPGCSSESLLEVD